MTINDRALAYLRQTYKGRNIRVDERGGFEMSNGANFRGDTFWFRIAYIASPSDLTEHQTLLVDVTGDRDRIMLIM